MKVCKIMPDAFNCRACSDMAETCGAVPSCHQCHEEEFELMEIAHSFWGSSVVVIRNGKLEKVPMYRVYDVREKEGADNAL